jgi:hypothetical protein
MPIDISAGGGKIFVDSYEGEVHYEINEAETDKQLKVYIHMLDSNPSPEGARAQIDEFENALKTAAKEAGKTQLVITSYDVPRDGILQNQGYTGNASSVKKLISLVAGGRRNTRRNRKNHKTRKSRRVNRNRK